MILVLMGWEDEGELIQESEVFAGKEPGREFWRKNLGLAVWGCACHCASGMRTEG